MAICDLPDCDEHYACRMRAKSVVIAPSATPSRHNRKSPQRARYNAWERGVAGEQRAGGTRMPYIGTDGQPIRLKKYHEKQKHYDGIQAQRHAEVTRH